MHCTRQLAAYSGTVSLQARHTYLLRLFYLGRFLLRRLAHHHRVAYASGHFPALNELLFTRKPILAYYGFLGDSNYGDELVFEAARHLFRKRAVLLPVRYHMPIHLWLFVKCFRSRLRGLIIGGGTLIGPLWDRAFYERLVDQGVPVYVHGTGVLEHLEAADGWSRILLHRLFGGVRGPKSQINSKRLLPNALIVGDAAFEMFRPADSDAERSRINTVLINIGTHSDYIGSEVARRALRGFLSYLLERGYKIHFLPCHYLDVELARKLGQEFPSIQVLPLPRAHAETIPFFEAAAFAVGERLHFTAMAIMGGCPFVSINYAPKHEDLLASLALEEAGVRPLDVTLDELIRRFESREAKQPEDVGRRLIAFQHIQREQAKLFLAAVSARKPIVL